MKLKRLKLESFRCFEDLTVDFDVSLIVFVAENGQGKSALLDAIRIGLWPFVNGFDLASSGSARSSGNNISISDVRMERDSNTGMRRQLPASVQLEADLGENPVRFMSTPTSWKRFRGSERTGTKTRDDDDARRLNSWAKQLQRHIRKSDASSYTLPVFGYYGTCRLCTQKRLTKTGKGKGNGSNDDFYVRTFAYLNCLDPESSYKHFKEWFTLEFKSYREQQIKLTELKEKLKDEPDDQQDVKNRIQEAQNRFRKVWDRILVIQQVIDIFLKSITGWHTLEYSVTHDNHLILSHDHHGILKVDQLSDGIRGVLSMVGDIAYRCIKLNPHLGVDAAQEAVGVVMIDEVDMHLHPRWQQVVLGQLQEAFPKLQFIVTTHSPQVLTTVASKHIRILRDGRLYGAPPGTEGAEPERMLKQVQGLAEVRPPALLATKELKEYLDLVNRDKWNDPRALELRKILDERYQGHEPALLDADLLIENRKWELGE